MNKILRIKDGQDMWLEDEERVATYLKDYFEDIFLLFWSKGF